METILGPQTEQKRVQRTTQQSIDKFVQEIEARPFVYLGQGYWYSRQTNCIYQRLNGKLEFVADYSEKI